MRTEKRRPKLGWDSRRKCWRKRFLDRQFYFTHLKDLPKPEARQKALEEWSILEALMRNEVPIPDDWRSVIEPGLSVSRIVDYAEFVYQAAALPEPLPRPIAALPAPPVDASLLQPYFNRLPGYGSRESKAEPITSIDGLIATYLAKHRQAAETQQISTGMYYEHKRNLDVFRRFCQEDGRTEPSEIDAECLEKYRACIFNCTNPELAGAAQERCISLVTVKKRLARAKEFVHWAFDNHHIPEVPRNLRRYAKVKLPKTEPPHFSIEELKGLYRLASDKTRLYLLLGLNMAATQVDLATLEHSMIDWPTGVVTRNRNKTSVPTCFRLWPESLELLRKYATDPKEHKLVLLGSNGKPLVYDRINANASMTRIDTIRMAWDRLRDRVNRALVKAEQPVLFQRVKRGSGSEASRLRKQQICRTLIQERKRDSRGFKCLRKTTGQLVYEKFGPYVRDCMLGHAEANTVAESYTKRDFGPVFDALDWLRNEVGFGD